MIQNEYNPIEVAEIQQQSISEMNDAVKDNDIQEIVEEPRINN